VLKGGKGCGKGVFLRSLGQCFGSHYLHMSQPDHLLGRFNSHFRSVLLMYADEAFWAGDKRGEGVLKALITEPTFILEEKGIPAVGWRFPPLTEARREWERQFGGWTWNWPDLSDWT
jgi:hypothetical protein